jgi:hypothetical protein
MKNDLQTSLSEKISKSLIDGAAPVAAVTSATRGTDGKSTMRVSSLDSMLDSTLVKNPAQDSRGLKIQEKSTPSSEKSGKTSGAKVLSIKPGAD